MAGRRRAEPNQPVGMDIPGRSGLAKSRQLVSREHGRRVPGDAIDQL
jgi:hypothetical protein